MADYWAVINKGMFYDPRFRDLPPYITMLYQFLLFGLKDITPGGIVNIHSGGMEMPISKEANFHHDDGWQQFRKDIPEAKDLNFSNLGSRVYPFVEVLELRGLIEYDKPHHLLRIVDFHRHCKFNSGFGGDSILAELNKKMKDLGHHEFFTKYLQENKEELTPILEWSRERFAKKVALDSQRECYQTKEEKESKEYKILMEAFNSVRNAKNPDKEALEVCCILDSLNSPKTTPTSCKLLKLRDSVQKQGSIGSR